MKKIFGYIYETKNLITNKFYIGQKSGCELDSSYLGSGKLIIKAIKKYGKENFSLKLLAVAPSRKELNTLEIKFISEYRNFHGNEKIYNIEAGGYKRGFTYKFSRRHKNKISISLLGRKLTEEHKKNIGVGSLGHPVSKETRNKISRANMGYPVSKETLEKLKLANLGRPLSEEHKIKVSLSLLGKNKSKAHALAIRNSLYNKNRELYYKLKEKAAN